jgi:glycopeptide antibiotics resistance protein
MRRVVLVPFRDGRPMGHVLNVLLFVPAGVIGMGLGWPAARVLGAGAAVSAGTEFSQLFTRRRVASVTDLILNTTGTGLGIALARRRRRAIAPAAPRQMHTPGSSA